MPPVSSLGPYWGYKCVGGAARQAGRQADRGLGVSPVMLPLGHEDDDDAKGKEANCGSVAPQFE